MLLIVCSAGIQDIMKRHYVHVQMIMRPQFKGIHFTTYWTLLEVLLLIFVLSVGITCQVDVIDYLSYRECNDSSDQSEFC